ncbi:transposase [Singulisphaera rosea]
MPYRTVTFQAGHYYHVYNRGVNRNDIFFERENYLFFLQRLRHSLVNKGVDVISYCLMPNHYHLLVLLNVDDLGSLMHPLLISYTKAVNKRFGRVGTLFQGGFQAIHVDGEEYLIHLSRYIHPNPVKAGLVQHPEDWEFSSYQEFVGKRSGTLPRPEVILSQFPEAEVYRFFVEAGLGENDAVIGHLTLD